MLPRSIRAAALLAAATLLVTLSACGEKPDATTTTGGDSAATGSASSPSADTPVFRREPPRNLSDSVYQAYAALAIGISRREQDSIVKSTPITEIEAVMAKRMARQDTVARRQIADHFEISLDSVDALLAARNVPRRR